MALSLRGFEECVCVCDKSIFKYVKWESREEEDGCEEEEVPSEIFKMELLEKKKKRNLKVAYDSFVGEWIESDTKFLYTKIEDPIKGSIIFCLLSHNFPFLLLILFIYLFSTH